MLFLLFFFCIYSKQVKRSVIKKNPLKNMKVLARLNPYAIVEKRARLLEQEKIAAKKIVDKAVSSVLLYCKL